MPPRPEPGSYWYSSQRLTHVVEVVQDRRFTKNIRLHFHNNLDARQPINYASEANFHKNYQAQPRVDLQWINEGSVWRPLPRQGWRDRDPNLYLGASDLVVVDSITAGGTVRRSSITLEHGLRPDSFLGTRTDPIFAFTASHARVWCLGPPTSPDDPATLYPEILYRLQRMTKPDEDGRTIAGAILATDEEPTVEDLDRDIQSIVGRPRSRRQRRDLATQHNANSIREAEDERIHQELERKAKAKERRKARKKKTSEPVRRSAWQRLMDDES